MAGDWIKFRKKLIRDGRVLTIARKCNASRVTAIGAIVTLWCLGDEYCEENGALTGYTKADLETEIGLPGFLDSLPIDWFIMDGETPQLPMYQQHNGETAKQRACTANRVDKFRKRVTQRPLPEKRREEKRRTTTTPYTPASTKGDKGGGGGGGLNGEIDWEKAASLANTICVTLKTPSPPAGKYRRMIIQAAHLSETIGETWLDDSIEDTLRAKPTKVWSYFRTCLYSNAAELGLELGPMLARMKVPAKFNSKPR